jgi:hypothetical protein
MTFILGATLFLSIFLHQLKSPLRKSKLNELERKFDIMSVRKPPPLPTATQAVISQVLTNPTQTNGPLSIKDMLKVKGLAIPRYGIQHSLAQYPSDATIRDTVRKIMQEHFPDGFDKRFPGHNKPRIPRSPLHSSGPFHEISADGHEKLSELALRMGGIGLPIYGFKDKWSDMVLKLVCLPNCRTLGPVAHLYLDLVEEQGGTFSKESSKNNV